MPVYIIRAGATDMVKIGWADDPEARRQSLQCAHYEALTIIRVIDGFPAHERWLHRHFASRHHAREWFTFCPEMLNVVPPCNLAPPVGWGAADDLIAAFGGRSAVAEITGAKPNAVTQWRVAGVPHKYWFAILEAASARNLDGVTRELLEQTRPAEAEESAPGDFAEVA